MQVLATIPDLEPQYPKLALIEAVSIIGITMFSELNVSDEVRRALTRPMSGLHLLVHHRISPQVCYLNQPRFAFTSFCPFPVTLLFRFAGSPGKCSFVKGAMNVIDVLAILPYYLDLFMADDIPEMGADPTAVGEEVVAEEEGGFAGVQKLMRVFSILKILRVIKIARHSTGIQVPHPSSSCSNISSVHRVHTEAQLQRAGPAHAVPCYGCPYLLLPLLLL